MALSKHHELKDKTIKQIIHLYIVAFSLTSSTSILPFSIVLVTIIVIPAIAAERDLFREPKRESNKLFFVRHSLRWWYARMVIKPAYSPAHQN
jgi:hypothetical protein